MTLAILLLISQEVSASLKDVMKEGKSFGKEQVSFDSKQLHAEDFVSKEENGKTFDPKDAKQKAKGDVTPDSDAFRFITSAEVLENEYQNKGFEKNEWFIRRSEEVIKSDGEKGVEYADEGIYEIKKCRKGGDPFPISFTRSLKMDVIFEPEVKEEVQVCDGHKKKKHYRSKSEANKKAKKIESTLASDATVRTASVDVGGGGLFSKYTVKSEWAHVDNAKTCDKFHKEIKLIRPEQFEISNERWVSDGGKNLELVKTPQCTLVDQTCLDPNTAKTINGKKIDRKCWKERLSYICVPERKNGCSFLQSGNCEEVSRKCLRKGPFGCSLWELSFRCLSGIKRTPRSLDEGEVFGLSGELWETEYEPNESFAEVATKLSVFEEIQNEIRKTEQLDSSRINIFNGKRMKCERSVADDVMYDCCFSFSGLAKKLNLSHCNAEEVALAEAKEKGFCRYIEKKTERFLGVKTKDKHVFCCFPSKLARVFQEQSRVQLNIGWGSPDHPNCSGLHVNELSRLDFSKIDLSEAYEETQQRTADLERKLDSFRDRLVEQLEIEKKELRNENVI
ncbi:MAG: conjugal transfer protein TraN [Waddliaceae bacterium]